MGVRASPSIMTPSRGRGRDTPLATGGRPMPRCNAECACCYEIRRIRVRGEQRKEFELERLSVAIEVVGTAAGITHRLRLPQTANGASPQPDERCEGWALRSGVTRGACFPSLIRLWR